MNKLLGILIVLATALVAVPAASASDSSAAPTPLVFGVPAVEDISNYGVEASELNTFAPFNQTCDVGRPVGVAHTAWFAVQGNGAPVTVSTGGSALDTSMFVYSGSPSGDLVGCSDDGPGVGVNSLVSFTSASGTTYFVQAGRFCDANAATACKPTPPTGGSLTVLATTPAAGSTAPTGQRAAALKKCLKKKKKQRLGAKAFKKCKQRAKNLPL